MTGWLTLLGIVVSMLDPTAINQVIEQERPYLELCYEAALNEDPNLDGRYVLSVDIQPDGSVAVATLQGIEPQSMLADCVAQLATGWTFPAGSEAVQMQLPIRFKPVESVLPVALEERQPAVPDKPAVAGPVTAAGLILLAIAIAYGLRHRKRDDYPPT